MEKAPMEIVFLTKNYHGKIYKIIQIVHDMNTSYFKMLSKKIEEDKFFDYGITFEKFEHAESFMNSQMEQDPYVSSLEQKILKAKKLGVKFIIVPEGMGAMQRAYNVMEVLQTITDSDFEKSLNKVIERCEKTTYLSILTRNGLIE